MIKKTLYFGNPIYISFKNKQLVIDTREKNEEPVKQNDISKTILIEDIGVVILDHYGVVISQFLLSALLENNVAVITCDQ